MGRKRFVVTLGALVGCLVALGAVAGAHEKAKDQAPEETVYLCDKHPQHHQKQLVFGGCSLDGSKGHVAVTCQDLHGNLRSESANCTADAGLEKGPARKCTYMGIKKGRIGFSCAPAPAVDGNPEAHHHGKAPPAAKAGDGEKKHKAAKPKAAPATDAK